MAANRRCPLIAISSRSVLAPGGHDSLASAALDRRLRDRAPVLRCYGCAILAPSQQVRLRSARCLRPQKGSNL